MRRFLSVQNRTIPKSFNVAYYVQNRNSRPWRGVLAGGFCVAADVEFADWNGQTAIGKGNCDSGAKINMSKQELKELIRETVKEVIDEENPIYKDLADVPDYWKRQAAGLLNAGAINGGTPAEVCGTDLNIRRETLKAAIMAVMYHNAEEGRK